MTTVEHTRVAVATKQQALGEARDNHLAAQRAFEQAVKWLAEAKRVSEMAREQFVSVSVVKVVYFIDELAVVIGVHPDALRRRIHNGTLRARHTGHRYIVTGPAAVAAGLCNTGSLVDYHETINLTERYTLKELSRFLDLSYHAARRLVVAQRIAAVEDPTMRVMILGRTIVEYLDGGDDPMQHPESA